MTIIWNQQRFLRSWHHKDDHVDVLPGVGQDLNMWLAATCLIRRDSLNWSFVSAPWVDFDEVKERMCFSMLVNWGIEVRGNTVVISCYVSQVHCSSSRLLSALSFVLQYQYTSLSISISSVLISVISTTNIQGICNLPKRIMNRIYNNLQLSIVLILLMLCLAQNLLVSGALNDDDVDCKSFTEAAECEVHPNCCFVYWLPFTPNHCDKCWSTN